MEEQKNKVVEEQPTPDGQQEKPSKTGKEGAADGQQEKPSKTGKEGAANGQQEKPSKTGEESNADGQPEKENTQSSGLGDLLKSLFGKGEEQKKDVQELAESISDAAKEPELEVDKALVESGANLIGSLKFSDILANPLRAAIKAQRDMSKETLAYIREEGLITDKNTHETKVAVITLSYVKNGKMVKMRLPLLSLIPIPQLGISEIKLDFKIAVDSQSSLVKTVNGGAPAGAALFKQTGGLPSSGGDAKKSGDAGAASAAKGATAGAKTTDAGASKQEGSAAKTGNSAAAATASPQNLTVSSAEITAKYSSKKDSAASQSSRYAVETTMDVQLTAVKEEMPPGLKAMMDFLSAGVEEININGELSISAEVVKLQDGHGLITASYINGEGIFDSGKIEVKPLANGGETAKLYSGDEVIVLFDKAGTYEISAEKLKRVVFVS